MNPTVPGVTRIAASNHCTGRCGTGSSSVLLLRDAVSRACWRPLAALALLMYSIASAPHAVAQIAEPPPTALQPDRSDIEALEASLDSLLSRRMQEYHLPGLAIVAVREGEILLLKGYGKADLATGRPVDPRTTLFRVASVSKTVTAAAVMQLVERGLLDLHADLGRSVPELPPAPGADPLTLAHLLTHTAALDEQALGRATRDSTKLLSLANWLRTHPPRRIGAPGWLISYNDVGYTLAGRAVETAAEMPFPDYVEQHVFRPLGMERSTFHQILPDSLRTSLATGYDHRNGAHRPVAFDYIHQTPPAGMMTTAADMAAFLFAHLDGGEYAGRRILAEETVGVMHRRQFGMDSHLQGTACGLWEIPARGRRALWHGGDWNGYGAVLFLLPDQRAGLFAAFNGRSSELPHELMSWFTARMVPGDPAPPPPAVAATERTELAHLRGTYRFTRIARASLAALPTILSGQVPEERIAVRPDGTLSIFGQPWVEVEPLLFRRADGRGPGLRFIRDPEGRTTHMVLNGFETYERVPWYGTLRFHLALLGACLVSFVAVLLTPIVGWFRGRRRAGRDPESREARYALTALISAAAVSILCVGGMGVALTRINPLDFMAEIPAWTMLLLTLPIAGAATTATLPVFALRLWLRREWSLAQRVAYSGASLMAMAFVWSLAFWNLVGFHF